MIRHFKRLTFIITCLVFFLLNTPVGAEGFTLPAKKITINEGEVYSLSTGIEGTKYYSYNKNIAKIDDNGMVLGVNAGNTTVYARIKGERQLCAVKVVKPSVEIKQTSVTLYVGDNGFKTKATVKPSIKGVTNMYTTSIDDHSIISISEKNEIVPLKEGKTKVTVSANGITNSYSVDVIRTSISLDKKNVTISNSKNKEYNNILLNVDSLVGPKKNIKWSSSDTKVVKVSNGKVTAVSEGMAVVAAESNGATALCNVAVVSEESLFFKQDEIDMYKGCTQLAPVSDADAALISSDSNIAEIDGLNIHAKGKGKCVVCAKSGTNVCEMIVKVDDFSDSISMNTLYFKPKSNNTKYPLNLKVRPTEKVVYTSSNTNIVSVDKKGVLTLKKPGESDITVECNGTKSVIRTIVDEFAADISLNYKELHLYTGKNGKSKLTAKITGRTKSVSYNSSDQNVAKVDKKGNVSAVNKGVSVIYCTANGITKECLVTVDEPDILFDRNITFVKPGESVGIVADIIGYSQKAEYKIEDKKIAVINKGKILGKALGETTLTIKANGITKTHKIVVGECSHEFDEIVITPATCSISGESKYKCKICDYEYSDKTCENRYNHGANRGELIVIAPTCTEDGVSYSICLDCNVLLSKDTAGRPRLGHDCEWNELNGIEYKTCKRCNAVVNIKPVGLPEKINITDPDHPDNPLHVHIYNKPVIVSEPTCVLSGVKNNVCICGDTISEVLPKRGHIYEDNYTIDIEATCKTDGEKSIHCSVCGEKRDKVFIPRKHRYENNYKCKYCDKYKPGFYRNGLLLVAWDEANIDIEKDYTLEDVMDTESTPVEHALSVTSELVEVTKIVIPDSITSIGKYAFAFCDNLEEVYIPDSIQEIPEGAFSGCTNMNTISLGSSIENINQNAFNDCVKLVKFMINNESYENTEELFELFKLRGINIDPTAFNGADNINKHNYCEWIVDYGTECESPGMQYRVCRDCNYEQVESIPALGHDWQEPTVDISANCVSIGFETRKCSRCGCVKDLRILPALEHERSQWIIKQEPSCTLIGTKVIECKRCGEKLEDGFINALGHDFVLKNIEEATCDSNGNIHYQCSRCTETKDIQISALGHSPLEMVRENVVNPTCTIDGGYDTVQYCDRCGGELTRNHTLIRALGHEEVNGSTLAAHKKCSRCNVILISEHCYTSEVIKDSTCSSKGITKYTCDCGFSYEEQDIELKPHISISDASKNKQATCTSAGWKDATKCLECSVVLNPGISIAALGHDYGTPSYIWTSDNKTCTAKRICTRNDSHVEIEDASTTSSVKIAATCTTKGTTTYRAIFSNTAFNTQTMDAQDISVNPSNHTGTAVIIGTSSVHSKYVCCGVNNKVHDYVVDSGQRYSDATCLAKQKNYAKCSCGYNPRNKSYMVEVGNLVPHLYNNTTGYCEYGCESFNPDAYKITWNSLAQSKNSFNRKTGFIGAVSETIASSFGDGLQGAYLGNKRIKYTKPNCDIGYANPYYPAEIIIKKGTCVYMQMFAGDSRAQNSQISWNIDDSYVGISSDSSGRLITSIFIPTSDCTFDVLTDSCERDLTYKYNYSWSIIVNK